MTPAERAACRAALVAAERAAEALRRVLDADAARCPAADDLVPLKQAAAAWGVSYDAALKRARRGAGQSVGGRWYVPRSEVEQARRIQPADSRPTTFERSIA